MRIARLAAILLGTSLLASPALAQTSGQAKYGPWGVDLTTMDTSIRPGDDFFGYALGTWLRDAPIAADKSRAGYNYDLPDETEVEVRKLIEDAGTAPADPALRQIVDLYDPGLVKIALNGSFC